MGHWAKTDPSATADGTDCAQDGLRYVSSDETKVLQFARTVSRVARAKSRQQDRIAVGFSQKDLGEKERYLCGSARRGTLLRLDRRRPEESERNKLYDSVYTTKGEKHLESC